MHEDLDITNNGQQAGALQPGDRDPLRFRRHLRGEERTASCGAAASPPTWSDEQQELRITYRNKDFCREVHDRHAATATAAGGVRQRPAELRHCARTPAQAWHRCLIYDLVDGNRHFHAPHECTHASARRTTPARSTNGSDGAEDPHQQRGILSLLSSGRSRTWRRCGCRSQGTDHMVFVPAAGLPWFVALFGRDSLIVSLQNMLIYPEFAARRAGGARRASRRRSATTTATPSRARSCTSCATASSRISS